MASSTSKKLLHSFLLTLTFYLLSVLCKEQHVIVTRYQRHCKRTILFKNPDSTFIIELKKTDVCDVCERLYYCDTDKPIDSASCTITFEILDEVDREAFEVCVDFSSQDIGARSFVEVKRDFLSIFTKIQRLTSTSKQLVCSRVPLRIVYSTYVYGEENSFCAISGKAKVTLRPKIENYADLRAWIHPCTEPLVLYGEEGLIISRYNYNIDGHGIKVEFCRVELRRRKARSLTYTESGYKFCYEYLRAEFISEGVNLAVYGDGKMLPLIVHDTVPRSGCWEGVTSETFQVRVLEGPRGSIRNHNFLLKYTLEDIVKTHVLEVEDTVEGGLATGAAIFIGVGVPFFICVCCYCCCYKCNKSDSNTNNNTARDGAAAGVTDEATTRMLQPPQPAAPTVTTTAPQVSNNDSTSDPPPWYSSLPPPASQPSTPAVAEANPEVIDLRERSPNAPPLAFIDEAPPDYNTLFPDKS